MPIDAPMTVSDSGIEIADAFAADLKRAGAGTSGLRGALRHFILRHPLGAAGAIMMSVFVFGALFADLITIYDPLQTDSALSLARTFQDARLYPGLTVLETVLVALDRTDRTDTLSALVAAPWTRAPGPAAPKRYGWWSPVRGISQRSTPPSGS